jgi:ribose transport system substrate-binding protein
MTRTTTPTVQRATATLGALALVLGASACGRGGDDTAAGGTGGGESVQLTLALSTLNNPFFIELRDGAQAAADEGGAELTVVDAQNDAAVQANQLANAQTQGVDAVLVNPVDSAAAGPAVAPLVESGVPVIAVDRAVEGAEVATTVSSDNVEGGRQAAQALAEAIGGSGQIIVLQGVPGTSASRDRGQGFAEGIAEFPDIEVVASQPANFDRNTALDVATNLLQANPGVAGIFAENDEMALGAIQALGDRAGAEVQVVGFDGTDEGLAAVQDGTMYATIAQLPAELGRTAVERALAVIKGETVEETVPVPVETVTAKNVGDFIE